jgi:hypothetical protein
MWGNEGKNPDFYWKAIFINKTPLFSRSDAILGLLMILEMK